MYTYETTATMEEQGRIVVAGVPFAPGTEVEITVSPKVRSGDAVTRLESDALVAARERMMDLFRTIKGFRNSPRIPREELYERGRVR